MYHIFFVHSSVEGHLGCFQFLAVINLCYPFPPLGHELLLHLPVPCRAAVPREARSSCMFMLSPVVDGTVPWESVDRKDESIA